MVYNLTCMPMNVSCTWHVITLFWITPYKKSLIRDIQKYAQIKWLWNWNARDYIQISSKIPLYRYFSWWVHYITPSHHPGSWCHNGPSLYHELPCQSSGSGGIFKVETVILFSDLLDRWIDPNGSSCLSVREITKSSSTFSATNISCNIVWLLQLHDTIQTKSHFKYQI